MSAPESSATGRPRSRRLSARAALTAAAFILFDVLFGAFAAPRLLAPRSEGYGPLQIEPEREELVIQGEPAPGEALLGREATADFNLDVEAGSARIDKDSADAFLQLAGQEPPATWGEIRYFSPPASAAAVSCPMGFRADAVGPPKAVELRLADDTRAGDRLRSLRLIAPRADLRLELEPVAPPEGPAANGIGCRRLLTVGGQEKGNFRSVKIRVDVEHGSPVTLRFWRLKGWETATAPPDLLDLSGLLVRSLRVDARGGSPRLELTSRTGKADLRLQSLRPAGDKLQVTVAGPVLVSGSGVTLGQRPPLALAGLAVLGLLHAWPVLWLIRSFRRPPPETPRPDGRPADAPGLGLPTVFISYSHADEKWKDRLVKHIGVLEAEGGLEVWDDRRIGPGEDWLQAIETAMDEARVAVLLVSADFLSSRFIRGTEVPRCLEQRRVGLRVIPVIVHPCAWQAVGWLAQLQCRPKDGRPLSLGRKVHVEAALAALALEIRDLLRT